MKGLGSEIERDNLKQKKGMKIMTKGRKEGRERDILRQKKRMKILIRK